MNGACDTKRCLYFLVMLLLCGIGLTLLPGKAAGQRGEASRSRQGSGGAGPVAEIPVTTYDLGMIKSKGRTYQHDFLVLNIGSETLEINEVVVG